MPQAQHSTAQHSAISPARSSKPNTCRSERDNANKQAELARAENQHVEHLLIIHLAAFSKRTKKSKICRALNRIQALNLAGVMREAVAFISSPIKMAQHCLFLSVLSLIIRISYIACGVRVVLEHGALGICKSSVCA